MKARFCLLPIFLFSVEMGYAQKKEEQSFAFADSLFAAKDWKRAAKIYEPLLKKDPTNALEWNRIGFCYYNLGEWEMAKSSFQKALENKPSIGLENLIYSRLAKIFAQQNNTDKAFENLSMAIEKGFANVNELQTLDDFKLLRKDNRFNQLVEKATVNANPCMGIAQAREFDFWIGEWDAYVTGTNTLAGHSVIQLASGGCMILENWTSAGNPFSGKSMNFVDPSTKKWKQVWVGSNGLNVTEFLNGEYREGAMRFEYESKDAQGNAQFVHFYFFNESPDQVRQFQETSPDNIKWTTVYDFTYKRKH